MTNEIEIIVRILKEYEECLSDGYSYYCGKDKVDKILEEIAIKILNHKKETGK